jgi:hypothetical protein
MLHVETFPTRRERDARIAALKPNHSTHKTTTSVIPAEEHVIANDARRRVRGHIVWEARWYD